ncbi:MAG: carbohydrate binding family 9 domain-containing protein [Cyclobacteriaceae bacterium]|nr:carbohydrate binding family 9 domain-containing protein [Cyclobacteriaceae bacterium]
MISHFIRTSLLVLFSVALLAQNKPGMQLPIQKTEQPIVLDGKLDEVAWQRAFVATDFFMNFPYDTARAPFQTEARLTFDNQMLYVAFVCYDDDTPDLMQSLRRDFDFDRTDNIGIYLGPYNDRINGFYFQVTPYGVQAEGLIATGGAMEGSYNDTWDNKWYSKVVREKDRWVAELAIPFKSFRYKSIEEWNITFLRWDRKRNLASSWIATPIQFIPASFAYSGQLVWSELPPKSKVNISLIPYLAGSASRDSETTPVEKSNELQAGFDAKIGVTPALNLDLTVNPDFSQVEVDQQVINLTRFEFQFPERRQFFLENNDLFAAAGFPEARPFFSRRVGLAKDSSGHLVRVPILYGARLSGSLNKNWRVSMLNMHTKEKLSAGLPAQNYAVVAVQRNFWKQSNFTLMYVDKNSMGVRDSDTARYFHEDLLKYKVINGDSVATFSRYNRVLTADLDLRSADNTWYASFYYSGSFSPLLNSKNLSGGSFLTYTKRTIKLLGGHSFVQKNYNAEAGFVPSRKVYPGIDNFFGSAELTFYPKSKWIATMGPGGEASVTVIPGGTVTDKTYSVGYGFQFLNTGRLTAFYYHTYQQLTNTFNPIDGDKYITYKAGEEYNWAGVGFRYSSDQRKLLYYRLTSRYGGFYNGNNFNVGGEVNYRYQPFGSIAVRFDYNDLRLASGYGNEKLMLVGPRLDLTFTDKLFFTTFVQYNNLADNVNLNTRFQWRYKPASDFFIVYTENYLPEQLKSKNRALVFKFTYWLNV